VRVLLALRYLGFAVALLSFVLPWLLPAWSLPRSPLVRRIAVALGVAAQLGLTSTDVARGRAPWTKLVFPLVGACAAAEALWTSSFPIWAVMLVGACEIVLVGFVVMRALRVARRLGREYPETVLEAEFARLFDPRIARYFALEATLVTAAVRYLAGGFRQTAPAGFSYAARSDVPLLLAVPVFVILPEMIVFDLLIPAVHWPWRIASDLLHGYMMLWALGLYATFRDRPHRLEAQHVRFSCGALRTLVVERSAIVSATVRPATFDGRAWRRQHRADGLSLLVSGAGVVEIELAWVSAPGLQPEAHSIHRLAVSADRPRELVRALVAT